MEALRPGDARFYNLGIGRGYSVREVIEAAQRVTGPEDSRSSYGPRRAGDPAALLANADQDAPRAGLVGPLDRDRRDRGHRLELVPQSSAGVWGLRLAGVRQ